jgi:hypothetical protein
MAVTSFSKNAAKRLGSSDERVNALTRTEVQLSTRQEFVAEITSLWRDAQERFLQIGRYLFQAKVRLPHGEYQNMVEADLPFGIKIAHQLRSVAEAVERGRLADWELPGSYSTAYHLTTLSDTELQTARENNLLRPNLVRSEVIGFKRQLRSTLDDEQGRRHRRLVAERERLLARLQEIEKELAAVTKESERH